MKKINTVTKIQCNCFHGLLLTMCERWIQHSRFYFSKKLRAVFYFQKMYYKTTSTTKSEKVFFATNVKAEPLEIQNNC